MSHTSKSAPLASDRPTLFLSDHDVSELAEWPAVIKALRDAYALKIEDKMIPPRTMARGDGIWIRSLTAVSPSGEFMGSKLISASPKAKCASYLISLFDTRDMRLAGLLDGNQITGIRTAATTTVAIDLLAPKRPLRVCILGSGFEARGQLHALLAVRQISYATVFSPSSVNRKRFVTDFMSQFPDLKIEDKETAQQAVNGMDVIICAARSHDESPILQGKWLTPGMTVASIGSTLPEQREVDEDVIRMSHLIVADMPEEVLHETGDMLVAKKSGVDCEKNLISLNQLACGQHSGRSNDQEILLFKSVGSALQDVVVSEMLLKMAIERSIGTSMTKSIVPVIKW